MSVVNIRKQDQILMSLVHYFVTKENYSPIYVQGVKDEIWLERVDGPYRIIRINSNYIHNNEQFKFDQYKIKDILRQIKKKTLSLSVNALNINLNSDENVDLPSLKYIDTIKVNELKEIESNQMINEVFPNIKDNLYADNNGLDLIYNVTKDINTKTENDNKKYQRIFSPKKIFMTYLLIAVCIALFLTSVLFSNGNFNTFISSFANNVYFLRRGEAYRLITYAFLHANVYHLLVNMYSLYIVGSQIENHFGKMRFLGIYLISAIAGGLLSAGFSNTLSVGASGAIFGILGAMLYFGFKFRLYLKDSLRTRIIPVIILNLAIGFMMPGIDNACHVGGLIAGYLASMAIGIPGCETKKDSINGTILLIIFIAFLSYLAFIR